MCAKPKKYTWFSSRCDLNFNISDIVVAFLLKLEDKSWSHTTMLLGATCRKQVLTVLRKLPLRHTPRDAIKMCTTTTPPIDYTVPGTPGSGAGKGGGSGGSIREAGGGLGRLGAALEEGYFHQKQKEQLKEIKNKLQRGEQIDSADKPPSKWSFYILFPENRKDHVNYRYLVGYFKYIFGLQSGWCNGISLSFLTHTYHGAIFCFARI